MHKVKHRALSFAYPEKFQDVVRNIDINPVTEKIGFRHCICLTTVFTQMTDNHLVMEMLAGLHHHSEKLNLRGGTV